MINSLSISTNTNSRNYECHSSPSYPSHWNVPGLTLWDGSTVIGFWWKENMPPMLMSPSFENWDCSFVPYVWHTGFCPLAARRKISNRSAIMLSQLNTTHPKAQVWNPDAEHFIEVFSTSLQSQQGTFASSVFLSTYGSTSGANEWHIIGPIRGPAAWPSILNFLVASVVEAVYVLFWFIMVRICISSCKRIKYINRDSTKYY